MKSPYRIGDDFVALFGDAEYALKRSGYLRSDRDHAMADWDAFAKALGPAFFQKMVTESIAPTLIGTPPRQLSDALEWKPDVTTPLTNVHQLIVQGVCRVRNSCFHGEKFRGGADGQWQRDAKLIEEAYAVLSEALTYVAVTTAPPIGR
jgi:hypothetical protein